MEFLFISIIISLDQIIKFLIKTNLKPIGEIKLVNDFFSLTYVENRGAAFGIFANEKILLVGVTAAVVIGMLHYIYKNRNMSFWMKLSFILIIGGAIGNLIDRIFLGYVVDYLHFYLKSHDFPVFNLADTCVVIGTFLLALNLLLIKD